MDIPRTHELKQLREGFRLFPCVGIIGPRQCGKSTLSRQFATKRKKPVHFFDLESPRDLARLHEPLTALEDLEGLIIIDEIQLRPDLFPLLRVLIDRRKNQQWLVLGSAAPELLRQSSESLTGRIAYIEIGGFLLGTPSIPHWKKLWLRGGFPRSLLAKNDADALTIRLGQLGSVFQRDCADFGIRLPAPTFERFLRMVSAYHGQMLNSLTIATSLGFSDKTVRHMVDILSGMFFVRELSPWHSNALKRLSKRSKIYVRDTGLLHALLEIPSEKLLESHPQLGASFEGFCIEQILRFFSLSSAQACFIHQHSGYELDLVVTIGTSRVGFEVKYVDGPTVSKSMRSAMTDLQLSHLFIIYPGSEEYDLDKNVTVLPVKNIPSLKMGTL